MSDRSRQILTTAAVWVCVVASLWTLILIDIGGFDVSLPFLRISSHDPLRPVILAALTFALSLALCGPAGALKRFQEVLTPPVRLWQRIDPRWPAVALAIVVVIAGMVWNTKSAGGADSYGYVSQAELFLSGHLKIDEPWAASAPWPDPTWSFSPLGYRPHVQHVGGELEQDKGVIVPTYSPGLPMVMAIAKKVGGQCALYAVVPFFGGVLILATYGIGRRMGSSGAGLLGAWLVATSPMMLFMITQPMSDVPAAAVWAVALWCLLGDSLPWIAGAGAAAALGVLIRPNLVPVAAVMGLWLLWRVIRERHVVPGLARLAAFGVPVAAAALVIAWLNRVWYGSPLGNGYAPLGELFAWKNVGFNVRHYTQVFVETQTPLPLLGLAALFVPRLWPRGRDRAWRLSLLAVTCLAILGEYLAYQYFDYWFIVRLLLPVWPIVMIGFALLLLWPVRPQRPLVGLAVAIFSLMLGVWTVRIAAERSTFDLGRGENRYVYVAQMVRARTDDNSVIISMQHSGSLRYYGGRVTLQYMHFDQKSLDRAVAWFSQHGVHPYAVLDDWEVPLFRQRFGPANAIGRLAMPPMMLYQSGRVVMFDLLRPAGSQPPPESVAEPSTPHGCVPPVPYPRLVLN